ncbi:hypothetical protein UK82_29475 [Frankia sp. ACN1ag]|nr:hypothetical protein UK82_29475 [Frankia sp. ACN1ag]
MDAARARSVRDDDGDRTAFGGRPGIAVRIGGARAHRRLGSAAAPAATTAATATTATTHRFGDVRP